MSQNKIMFSFLLHGRCKVNHGAMLSIISTICNRWFDVEACATCKLLVKVLKEWTSLAVLHAYLMIPCGIFFVDLRSTQPIDNPIWVFFTNKKESNIMIFWRSNRYGILPSTLTLSNFNRKGYKDPFSSLDPMWGDQHRCWSSLWKNATLSVTFFSFFFFAF